MSDTSSPDDRLDVERAYDRWAPSYDDDRNTTRDLDAVVLRRARLVLAGRHVVELGCGTGKNTAWIAEHAQRLIAMDFSPGMLARARQRIGARNVHFVQHDVREPWPLSDASADAVIGNLILEHVADLGPVFSEAARVVRPGGQLYLCELHPFRQWRGGQAHFTDARTGETVHVSACVHTVGEYVNGGLATGFILRQLGEWVEEDAPAGAPPRLISVLFERV